MAMAARVICCQLPSAAKQEAEKREPVGSVQVPAVVVPQRARQGVEKNILLQPRLCNLRSYASDPAGLIKTNKRDGGGDEVSKFFDTLSEYIDSSRKSHDFEIISGRLAMILLAATVTTEAVTGTSLFRKMDVQGIAEAAGVCFGAVACAATFAWFSSARTRVGRMFTLGCNTLIDSLIDQIVDGLFYESELRDWSDDL